MITELKSVGSGIDQTGLVYPQKLDGTFDTSDGVDISDASAEWFSSLSPSDVAIVINLGWE